VFKIFAIWSPMEKMFPAEYNRLSGRGGSPRVLLCQFILAAVQRSSLGNRKSNSYNRGGSFQWSAGKQVQKKKMSMRGCAGVLKMREGRTKREPGESAGNLVISRSGRTMGRRNKKGYLGTVKR